MRAIDRRLRRIEARLTPPNNPEDQRGESSLRDLIRRRCEKTGHPYVGPTPEFAGLSLTEIKLHGLVFAKCTKAKGTIA
jgi:hypothetical protein